MFELESFYTTKQWVNLVRIIKNDRTNSQGEIICEHCGRAIVKAYDCIGHHIIYLTKENVNDAMISLNPDNVALVHHRCHNKIHNKLGHQERNVYIVWGSPYSGKSSFVKENLQEGDLLVDMDKIWKCISGMESYTKPNRIKSCVFGIHEQLIEMIRVRRGNWINAYVVGGYPFDMERERLQKELGARTIHIDTNKEECIINLKNANDGRDIKEWTEYINTWWNKYAPHI
ncbi:MAG: HNH endonuclease [Lachnospiraceae bacterium]|nr:HNH endonuclease [Lachnospiraceae bacterium]